MYILIGDTAFWSSRAPALRANVKPAPPHPVKVSYKQALASVLPLTTRTIPLSLTSSRLRGQLPFAASLLAERAS